MTAEKSGISGVSDTTAGISDAEREREREREGRKISTETSVNAIPTPSPSGMVNQSDLSRGLNHAGERVYPANIENGIDEH